MKKNIQIVQINIQPKEDLEKMIHCKILFVTTSVKHVAKNFEGKILFVTTSVKHHAKIFAFLCKTSFIGKVTKEFQSMGFL